MSCAAGKGNRRRRRQRRRRKILQAAPSPYSMVEKVIGFRSSLLAARWRMLGRRLQFSLGLLLGVFWASGGGAEAQGLPFFRSRTDQWQKLRAAALVPLDQVPASCREAVRVALEKPTLFTSGPGESFVCRPDLYYWFLDHPDRAVTAWRRLGAVCLDITERSPGRFGWADAQGNDLWWETIYKAPGVRVWYAQGMVKPTPVLPLVPVQVVVVLRHAKTGGEGDGVVMFHQADVFVHTDSRAAALATKLLGPAGPRMAEQGVAQMQMFFSALAWYCQRHPERTERLLGALAAPHPPADSRPAPLRDNG
jgi:hypothetical protein